LRINGTATFGTATFAGLNGTLTIGEKGNATFTAATFALLNGLTVNGQATLNGSVAPTVANFVVGGTGPVTIGSTGLTIGAGKTLTNNGNIVLNSSSGKLTLATVSDSDVSLNGGIAGTGTITAGATTIAGTWRATGKTTSAGTVVITAASTGATISTDTSNGSGLKANAAGAAITQGTGSTNALAIAASTTIDLNTMGRITLTGASTNPGSMSFVAATSILTAATGDSTALGGVDNLSIGTAGLTAGGSFEGGDFKATDTGNFVGQIGGAHEGTITAKTANVLISSTVTLVNGT
jgi:hypothetical protein